MLSACAPMTAAVRLPPQSNAADRKSAAYSRALNAPLRPCPSRLVGLTPTREQRNCAALNAVCVKDRGDATCVCNVGFAMTPTGCVDTCVLKACGVNGKCVKDSAGAASCVCDTGFALQADGKTCTDVCIIKNCQGSDANSTCVKNGNLATCVCKTGFAMANGKCT
ncbi:unnamed protein product, partial [Closterium sp. NIES-64]